MKITLIALFLVACGIGIGVFISSPEEKKIEKLPELSAQSPEGLMSAVEKAYRKGDHYTILSYMDISAAPQELLEVLATVLSIGAGEENITKEMTVTTWEEFKNQSGIPGNWKGKELKFSHPPEGAISISSSGENGASNYNMDFAYYKGTDGYRLCGIQYKNE